jgi:hypothetical protein
MTCPTCRVDFSPLSGSAHLCEADATIAARNVKFHALHSGEHGSGVQRHYAPYNLMGCPGGQFTNPVVPRAFPQNYGGQMLAGWAGLRAQADQLALLVRPDGVAPRAFPQDAPLQRFAAEMELPEDDLQQRFNPIWQCVTTNRSTTLSTWYRPLEASRTHSISLMQKCALYALTSTSVRRPVGERERTSFAETSSAPLTLYSCHLSPSPTESWAWRSTSLSSSWPSPSPH